jgi:glutamate racemase
LYALSFFYLQQYVKIIGDKIEILETGRPVALQLQRILKEFSLEKTVISNQEVSPDSIITFYNSSTDKQITSAMQKLWKQSSSAKEIDVLPLPTLE